MEALGLCFNEDDPDDVDPDIPRVDVPGERPPPPESPPYVPPTPELPPTNLLEAAVGAMLVIRIPKISCWRN